MTSLCATAAALAVFGCAGEMTLTFRPFTIPVGRNDTATCAGVLSVPCELRAVYVNAQDVAGPVGVALNEPSALSVTDAHVPFAANTAVSG